jgi:proline iminopeptidase
MRAIPFLVLLLAVFSLSLARPAAAADPATYFDNTGRSDVLSGGVRMIPIETPQGTLRVWTKRVGNHPTIKVLLLHGGPGFTHELFEGFDSYFPGEGIEYYYYDQLGSYYSDQPEDMTPFLSIEHYVEEVDQVRKALGLDESNFYLYGQSWGGMLAMEYALAHQEHLKGLIISNMMASIPAYNEYARDVLFPQMDPEALAEVQAMEAADEHGDPRYFELLVPHYEAHVLRLPFAEWPEPVHRSFRHMNPAVYVPMQGPSELGASGILGEWDRTGDLHRITAPTLVIGAEHDTMDPAHMEWMASEIPDARYLHCPEGSHLAQYDDPVIYMEGIVRFLRDVDAGTFPE